MDTVPFFSILLPTKNRAHLIGQALQSVLDQSFCDFEIIVADNDDTEATKQEVANFSDIRIKYFKTGGLSMPDNWEFARTKARGFYLTVLEDKQAYYPWALQAIFEVLDRYKTPVCVWNWDATNREKSPVVIEDFKLVHADEALRDYISGMMPWRASPRLLNSCASRDVIEKLTMLMPDNRLFIDYAPDLCAAFAQLGVIESFYYTSSSLGYMSSRESNATSLRRLKKIAGTYYFGADDKGLSGAVSLVPIKNEFIVHNWVYNDFLRVRQIIGRRLNNYEMSALAYARMCLNDCLVTLRVGGDCSAELRDVASYMVARLPIKTQLMLWAGYYSNWLIYKGRVLIKALIKIVT